MKNNRSGTSVRIFLKWIIAVVFLLTVCMNGLANAEIPAVTTRIKNIKKYGNLVLAITPEEMTDLGYEPTDIVSVSIAGQTIEMPVGTAYSNVDTGEPICCFKIDDGEEPEVCLSINMGDFASSLGIAVKTEIQDEPGYRWDWCEGYDDSMAVTISLVEKQGYADEYLLHQLVQTASNDRTDYPYLTDAQFANFRAVEIAGMGSGTLYRSSSPVNPKKNRNKEADEAMKAAAVQTVMNMADSPEEMSAYDGFETTYYAACDVIALNMGMDFAAESFRASLAKGLRFLASHNGPYLIHCNEGVDRSGFALGVLECLMGAAPEQVVEDYMLSYYNYYELKPGTEQYERIAASNIEHTLALAFHLTSIWGKNTDLSLCAENYLEEIGLTSDEIGALKDRLSTDCADPADIAGGSHSAAFSYIHDPKENPEAMKDIIENAEAVYGFSPDPESERLGSYAQYDWTDPAIVNQARESRIAYHESLETMIDILYRMRDEGASIEEMARAVSDERNRLRLEVYKDDPEGLAVVKDSNLKTYGHEDGPAPDELYEKYGSWQLVLQKAFSANLGMDACCGLYDEYYLLYVELGYAE